MRASIVLSATLMGLAFAAPKPQTSGDLDDILAAYDAIPNAPDVAAPVGDAPQPIAYNPTAAASSAVADATDVSSPSFSVKMKKRQAACSPERAGNYPTVMPDDPSDFLANPNFASIANSAPTPPGFFLVNGFKNLQASASDSSYLTYISSPLTSYDTNACAAKCTSIQGCVSFNIYFERDPSEYPDDTGCPNPSSITRIKCAFFGAPITTSLANNIGQYQSSFHVVIAGSNSYTTTPQPLPGFTGPVSLGDASIISPTSANTYMGVQTFPQTQAYDPSVCAAACNAKSAYNQRHAAPGVPARICVFFDAYILYKNGANGVFTCTYYTQSYDPSYATNHGQYNSAGDHYTIANSYTYTLDGN